MSSIITCLDIEDHLKCLLEERDHRVQSSQVEVILNELLGHFTEVFVSRE
jgi:hypothetical protein